MTDQLEKTPLPDEITLREVRNHLKKSGHNLTATRIHLSGLDIKQLRLMKNNDLIACCGLDEDDITAFDNVVIGMIKSLPYK